MRIGTAFSNKCKNCQRLVYFIRVVAVTFLLTGCFNSRSKSETIPFSQTDASKPVAAVQEAADASDEQDPVSGDQISRPECRNNSDCGNFSDSPTCCSCVSECVSGQCMRVCYDANCCFTGAGCGPNCEMPRIMTTECPERVARRDGSRSL